jgi:hypothetical protein
MTGAAKQRVLRGLVQLAHVIRDKNKLLNRIRRIKGQVEDPDHHPIPERAEAAQELIDVIRMYMK